MLRREVKMKGAGSIKILPLLAVVLLAGSDKLSGMDDGVLSFRVDFPGEGEYRVVERGDGQLIEIDGYNYLMVPGKPMLPARNVALALPPGALVRSVDVQGSGVTELPGIYRIVPTSPLLPLVGPGLDPSRTARIWEEYRENREAVYALDKAYPEERGALRGSGTLRKYSYVSVSLYPFSYFPGTGRLVRYDSAVVTVRYSLPSPGSRESAWVEALKQDTAADDRAALIFANYEEVKDYYWPGGSPSPAAEEWWDYVIITDSSLKNAITSSSFIRWKEDLGYRVRIVLTTDSEITSQPGADLAEKIRNFLRSYYASWGIEYVLMVGSYATVPMRYCYPDPTNHWNNAGVPNAESGEVPTDVYYADLSGADAASWDLDGDSYYGEYGQDSPDFLAELYVGRIPTNNSGKITYALDKLVSFEQDTGEWKDGGLNVGAFWYFTNEDRSGYAAYDGATCMNLIETDIMTGWNVSHYSEQAGLETSVYDWPALSETAFIGDWRENEYSVVNWGAHGWTNSVARKVWAWDDGDGVPETYNPNEMTWPNFITTSSSLDDDHPSTVFAISCMVGYPEPNAYGNLGIDLLTRPSWGSSIGVVSGARITYGALNWPVNPGGAESLCYEFNHYMIGGPMGPEKVGEAVYDSKFFCYDNYGFEHFAEYWNQYNFSLFGDPALIREGTAERVADDSDAEFVLLSGNWRSANHPNAHHGNACFIRSGDGSGRAGWRVDALLAPGNYDVYAWKFEHDHMHLMATDAPYRIAHRAGLSDWIYVDQSTSGSGWVYLGTFGFDDSRTQGVMITDDADGVVIADAIKFEYRGSLP